jgi:hypothetical protein
MQPKAYNLSEDHNDISSDEQDHQSNTSPSSYSHFATSRDNASAEHVPSPLAPSQKLWAKPGSEYSEHKIWEEQESPSQNGEKEQVRVVYQGHTDLKMDTNSGLAMGNVTSTTAKVVGQYFRDLKSQGYMLIGIFQGISIPRNPSLGVNILIPSKCQGQVDSRMLRVRSPCKRKRCRSFLC